MKDLVFYDKEGNYLNFNYNTSLDRYEGDILFGENSNDTFKTQALYMFEKLSAFEYENQSDLTIARWQLFNEYGFHFYASSTASISQQIEFIEPVNNDVNYYSKWIHGKNFQKKFPLGTMIRFDNPILEFTNSDQIFTVVSTKKDAILIISNVDNNTFSSSNWGGFTYLTYPYGSTDLISSVDIIGVYNYINPSTLTSNLSIWNEQDFYSRIYKNRKLNIVNSIKNDLYISTQKYIDAKIVTVKNENLLDLNHYEYILSNLPTNHDLWIEVVTRTDSPEVYTGGLVFHGTSPLVIGAFSYNNVLLFTGVVPQILKPGVEFKVPSSSLNNSFFKVGSISSFLGNANLVTYNEGQQVLWNNKIYQCIQTYTWVANSSLEDLALPIPRVSADPSDINYWTTPNYLPLNIQPQNETITAEVYLTQDHFYFTQSFTQSSTITLASAVDKFVGDFLSLNIDLYYQSSEIHADLVYPSNYAQVNFYGVTSSFGTSSVSIGTTKLVYERAIEVEERLTGEFNYDFSKNFGYNMYFTDLDDYGIIIKINKEIYQIETQFVYTSGVVDMPRTIDKTLRNWMTQHSVKLLSLGIISTLQTINVVSPYYNSINLKTEYPNVPLTFNVQVGTTANALVEKNKVIFYEPSQQALTISGYAGASYSLGNYINIIVNNRSYGVTHTPPQPPTFTSNLTQTLQNWVDTYVDILDDYGIYVNHSASSLNFDVKNPSQRCDIQIRVGASVLPGDVNYKIINKMPGNHGTLLTSNEILLATYSTSSNAGIQSFETSGFATGMVTGINGTVYPLQDVEFNILYLEPGVINLSYEGPFWGLTGSVCANSPFTIVAFTLGFTQSVCPPSPTSSGGMFNNQQFSNAFSIVNTNTSTYSVNTFVGIDNMVDLVYVPSSNSIFVFGETPTDDDIRVFDSITGNILATLNLPGNSNSIELIFNDVDNYVWALSQNLLWRIDPFTNIVVSQTAVVGAFSMDFDRNTGYVYVSTSSGVDIYNLGFLLSSISVVGGAFHLAFNEFEGSMYVGGSSNNLLKINPTTFVATVFTIPGLTTDPILYDSMSEATYAWGSSNLYKVDAGVVTSITSVVSGSSNWLSLNVLQSGVNVSNDTPEFSLVDVSDSYVYQQSYANIWGIQSLNLYDGDVYLSNQSPTTYGIWTFDGANGTQKNSVVLTAPTTQIISDPDRNSIWSIQPSTNQIIEIVPTLNYYFIPIVASYSSFTQSMFGSLDPGYIQRNYLWLHTKDFIRRPRENFNGEPRVSLYWRWFSDNDPEFFMYDFSGDLLPTAGALAYTGPKPLTTIHLNRDANRNPSWRALPERQQTIFSLIESQLDYIDDPDDLSIVPEPIETFIGYNSQLEGGLRSILQLFKKESIDFTINTLTDVSDIITFETVTTSTDRYGLITLDVNSTSNFFTDILGNQRGFKVGQHLAIFIKDESNNRNQYISSNNGYLVKIREVYYRQLVVDFFKTIDNFTTESTIVDDYPKVNQTTYLSVRFKIWDKELARFDVYGQSEIEDIRFETELGNVGKLVSSDDVYIFKEYDIKEEGIDWIYLNKKRKEMLMMKNVIYPFIGSYKSIINAINYFGYNDLELYEYYRNVNIESKNYGKLFKVEIPDIFDNSVKGWSDSDFIKHTFPNENYIDTNLFNLTYRITDRDGTNVLTYTLEEVQKKLNGLKYWLQKNIIPITHKILDITGRADFQGESTITHIVRDVNVIKVFENFTPVSFRLNELYLMPVNNGSTVYNCVLDFYSPTQSWSPYSGITQSDFPDYFTVDIKTYEIYREWYPFKDYMVGERVVYYDKLYESVIDHNQTNNPRKYENVSDWTFGTYYNVSDIVRYDRQYYVYTSYGFGPTASTASSVSPYLDSGGSFSNWLNITDWKEIDLVPIQRISERRKGDNLYPFNFTIDSNIDPYLVIEVTSDNGYGAIYRDKKNYEIKGILDIRELESYTNLTSKQYTNAVIGIVYPS